MWKKDGKFRETAQWPEKKNNPKRRGKKKKNRGKENIIEIDQENVSELEDVCLQVDRVYWMSSRIVKKITQAHSKVHYCLIDKEMTY